MIRPSEVSSYCPICGEEIVLKANIFNEIFLHPLYLIKKDRHVRKEHHRGYLKTKGLLICVFQVFHFGRSMSFASKS
nr:MAG TPA: Alkylmercury lyase [Caudoviricetes sp.]